ncbi:hypothetical protein [Ramlibacter sp.]|uniref:hypothetical protein n=1 Tax=Ramlibacter sp. TaxID=1917967 RepID=UPI002D7FF0FE|nr:hypothetical protein [Ramlibacter sp.]
MLLRTVFLAEEEVMDIVRQRADARREGRPDDEFAQPLKQAQARLAAARQRVEMRPVAQQAIRHRLRLLQAEFDAAPDENAAEVGFRLGRLGRIEDARRVLQWAIDKHPPGTKVGDDCRRRMEQLDTAANRPADQAANSAAPAGLDAITGRMSDALERWRADGANQLEFLSGPFRGALYTDVPEVNDAEWQAFTHCLGMTPAQLRTLPFSIARILPDAERLKPVAQEVLGAKLNAVQADFDRRPEFFADQAGLWLARLGRLNDARKVLEWGAEWGDDEIKGSCRAQLKLLLGGRSQVSQEDESAMTQHLDSVRKSGKEISESDYPEVLMYEEVMFAHNAQWLAFRHFLGMAPDDLASVPFDISGIIRGGLSSGLEDVD